MTPLVLSCQSPFNSKGLISCVLKTIKERSVLQSYDCEFTDREKVASQEFV